MNLMKKKGRTGMEKYVHGDPIPVPEVKEEASAEVWIQWLRAVAAIERKLRDTPLAAAPRK